MAVDEVNDDDDKLLRATRVITKAIAGAINQSRPALMARYGDDTANCAIIAAVCLNAHSAVQLATGQPFNLPDDTILEMVRSVQAVQAAAHDRRDDVVVELSADDAATFREWQATEKEKQKWQA